MARIETFRRVGVILAGGQSRRMSGGDKATVKIGGDRMIDLVVKRFEPQIEQVLIAGNSNYGTNFKNIPDFEFAPAGPVGGIYTIYRWLIDQGENNAMIYTCPVDAPLVTKSLIKKLDSIHASAFASTPDRDHPTFAKWRFDDLTRVFRNLNNDANFSLTALANECQAQSVLFQDEMAFANINTKNDLERVRCVIDGIRGSE